MIPPTDEDIKRKKRFKRLTSRFKERKRPLIISLSLELISIVILFISQYGNWPYALQNAWSIYFTIGLVGILLAVFFTFIAFYTAPKRFPGILGTCGLCFALIFGAGIFLSSGINTGIFLYIVAIFLATVGIFLPLFLAESGLI